MAVLIVVLLVLLVAIPVAGWALWILVSAALTGAIIGGVARAILPGKQQIGIFPTIVSGWVGSLVGGIFARHIFHFGFLLTLVCELAVAAALVAFASSKAGDSIARRNTA
jgi:uncharacterized membrane protein YeaQ/YmgE (transglycosylase-associated protein family)